MNPLNKSSNCVNSTTGGEISLQQRILFLIRQNLCNPDIALLTGAQPAYVRAVRSRATLDPAARRRRMNTPGRTSRAACPQKPRQSNLRELALKLHAMRQEGLL